MKIFFRMLISVTLVAASLPQNSYGQVNKHVVALAPMGKRVLYVGIDNHLKIAVSGVDANDFTVNVLGDFDATIRMVADTSMVEDFVTGMFSQKIEDIYIVRVSHIGYVYLELSKANKMGKDIVLGGEMFECKLFPHSIEK
ncbi:MAG: hypothetical protein JKX73_02560 [Flavobacteriales bacterium]|nr:hypothetical protein [Flavobacteriales bacterium]